MWAVTHVLFEEANLVLAQDAYKPESVSGIGAKATAMFEAYAIVLFLFMFLEFNIE